MRQVNAVISAIIGEVPLIEIRRQQIEGARGLLEQVLVEKKAERNLGRLTVTVPAAPRGRR